MQQWPRVTVRAYRSHVANSNITFALLIVTNYRDKDVLDRQHVHVQVINQKHADNKPENSGILWHQNIYLLSLIPRPKLGTRLCSLKLIVFDN